MTTLQDHNRQTYSNKSLWKPWEGSVCPVAWLVDEVWFPLLAGPHSTATQAQLSQICCDQHLPQHR